MKTYILLVLLITTIFSCSKISGEEHFLIKGSITDSIKNKEVILITKTKEIQDTTFLSSNKFEFYGNVSETTYATIIIGEKMIGFPLVNDEITLNIIDIDKNEYEADYELKYKTSKLNKKLEDYYNIESYEYIEKYKVFMAKGVVSKNDDIKYLASLSQDSLAINFLNQLIRRYKDSTNNEELVFILNDLTGLIGTRNHPNKIKEVFELLSEDEKNGFYGSKIKTFLYESEKIVLGQKVDFNFKDINEQTYSLNEFQGRLVLLEFWASWCGPCITQVPFLKQASKMSNKIQLISITIDEDLDKWKNKIDDLEMDWMNIHYKQKEINLKKYFFVTSVPHNILLSSEGKILRKNISMTDLLELLN